jgi:phosphoenolpyruvate carboxylase
VLQVELLRRLREAGEGEPAAEVWEAFVMTVNGVAAGMRNTG